MSSRNLCFTCRRMASLLPSAAAAARGASSRSQCWTPMPALRCLSSSKSRHPWFTDHQWQQRQAHRSEMEAAALRKRSPDLRKERRVAMLAGMLKTAVQEIFISGSVGNCLQGVSISKVQMDSNFTKVQIYWLITGQDSLDQEIRAALCNSASQVRQELHQRLLMSTVPPLEFLADKSPLAGGLTRVDSLLERARRSDKFDSLAESAARLAELYAPASPELEARARRKAERAEQRGRADRRDNGLPENLNAYGLDREALVRKVAKSPTAAAAAEEHRPLRYSESARCDLTQDPNYPLKQFLADADQRDASGGGAGE